MKVILTNNPSDWGELLVSQHFDCACDCNCACPIDGLPAPVLSLPVAYYLELTPTCNNRCPGCGNVYADNRAAVPAPLDGDGWRALLARLAFHAHQFKITGGEPVLHPAFAEIVQAVENHNVPFTLFTNGRWPRPDALIKLLRDTTTCEGLLVSLHGPNATAHESFSGVRGSFDETATNIRRATDAGLEVATSLVINRANWNRIEETLDLALGLGANHVVCNRLIGARVGAQHAAPLRVAIATIESLRAAGYPIRFGNCIPQCFEVSSSSGCTAGSTFATIDPWGRMRPCNHAPLIAGDLRTQSVAEAWRGAVMARWRALVPADCAVCPAFATCHGGCRAQALLNGQRQDPLMETALAETPSLPEATMLLYSELRPMGQFTPRFEGSVRVLIRKSQVVTVPRGYEQLVPQMDGSLTLSQIERRHGGTAVDWVGALYRQGMVVWAQPLN